MSIPSYDKWMSATIATTSFAFKTGLVLADGGAIPGLSTFLTGFSLSDLPRRLPRAHIRYGRLYHGGLLMGDRKFTPNFCKIGIG